MPNGLRILWGDPHEARPSAAFSFSAHVRLSIDAQGVCNAVAQPFWFHSTR